MWPVVLIVLIAAALIVAFVVDMPPFAALAGEPADTEALPDAGTAPRPDDQGPALDRSPAAVLAPIGTTSR